MATLIWIIVVLAIASIGGILLTALVDYFVHGDSLEEVIANVIADLKGEEELI